MQRRPSCEVNAGCWEFPNWEVDAAATADQLANRELRLGQAELEPLCTINHSITRYRNRLEMFVIEPARKPRLAKLNGEWIPLAKLDELPFTSSHHKAANQFC